MEFAKCVFASNTVIVKTFSHFCLLLDEPSVLHKSTRHVHHTHEYTPKNKNHKKHYGSPPTTSSTIIIRGLLDDYCFSDSDCTLTNSVCGQRTRRCMCKNGSHRTKDGKACILDNEISEYLEIPFLFRIVINEKISHFGHIVIFFNFHVR